MPRRRALFLNGGLAATLSLGCAAASAPADAIERRGSEPTLEGQIVRLDDNGVTLNSASGGSYTVPWDRIRDVRMDKPDPALDKYKEIGTLLWRARSRMERNDAPLAEPLFERLFEEYRGRTHETALIVAEGLLRCRLARGAHEAAVVPALEVARLRRGGHSASRYATLPLIMDEHAALCTALAPAWVDAAAMVKLERDLAGYDAQGDTVIAAQRDLYRRAVRLQLHMAVEPDEKILAAEHAGVALLRTMVDLNSPDDDRRVKAREALASQMDGVPEWSQAWSRFLIGMSLLRESGEGRREAGLVSLAYLPASFGAAHPYLAGLALTRMAEACESAGDSATAASLRNELLVRYPKHPALTGRPLQAPQAASNKEHS